MCVFDQLRCNRTRGRTICFKTPPSATYKHPPHPALIHKGSYTFATILMKGDSTFISYVFGMTNILDLYQYKNLNPTVNPNNHFQIRLPLYSFDNI